MTLELPVGIADDFELSVRLNLDQDCAVATWVRGVCQAGFCNQSIRQVGIRTINDRFGNQHGFELFECRLGVRLQGTPFLLTCFGGQQVERGRHLGKISDMSPEEIAQSEKGSNFGNVVRRLRGCHGFEFVRPRLDSVRGEFESEVTDLCGAEKDLGRLIFNPCFLNLVKSSSRTSKCLP